MRSPDNTAELLEFSSRPTPLASLAVLPLPPSRALPPPPGQGATAGAQRRGQPAQADQERRLARAGSRGVSAAASGQESAGDWALAVEQLRAFASQEPARAAPSSAASVDPPTADDAQGKAPIRISLESPLHATYQTLWAQARPHVAPQLNRISGHLAVPVEVRQVSWPQVRSADLPIRHGQIVVLPDKLLMFWLQGDKLYLLQTSMAPLSTQG
ncbi:MAG: hypothetical protein ACK6AD_03140 [Cyanobacteriota bacterium]